MSSQIQDVGFWGQSWLVGVPLIALTVVVHVLGLGLIILGIAGIVYMLIAEPLTKAEANKLRDENRQLQKIFSEEIDASVKRVLDKKSSVE